jgi:molybdopterin molybdotransferase
MSQAYHKSGERAEFLKAYIEGEYVYILDGQSSSMILSFSKANALAYIPEEVSQIQKEALIEVFVLPNI